MKDEIKEILEQLEWYRKIGKKDVYYPECILPNKQAFILLDCITNLQEENERLHTRIKTIKRRRKAQTAKMRKYREEITNKQNSIVNYKSRNEKAIKYNYELQERYCHSALFDDLVASKIYEITEKQLNILQGSDKDE